MKKLIYTLIIGLIAGIAPISAQTAKSVLDKTASTLSSYPSCTATYIAALGNSGSNSGTITIQGNKFYVVSSQVNAWFDGKTQWMYMPSSNEVNITTPTAQEIQRMNPYYFLNLYKSGYDLKLTTSGTNYVVTLTAQKDQSIKSMEITINQKSYLPSRVTMTSKKGSTSAISISNIKKGKKLSDASFQFPQKKYPRATVVDLR